MDYVTWLTEFLNIVEDKMGVRYQMFVSTGFDLVKAYDQSLSPSAAFDAWEKIIKAK